MFWMLMYSERHQRHVCFLGLEWMIWNFCFPPSLKHYWPRTTVVGQISERKKIYSHRPSRSTCSAFLRLQDRDVYSTSCARPSQRSSSGRGLKVLTIKIRGKGLDVSKHFLSCMIMTLSWILLALHTAWNRHRIQIWCADGRQSEITVLLIELRVWWCWSAVRVQLFDFIFLCRRRNRRIMIVDIAINRMICWPG